MEVLDLFLAGNIDLRICELPQGVDPADFLQAHGAQALAERIDGAEDALDYKLRLLTGGLDPARDPHRAHAVLEAMLASLAQTPTTPGQSPWSQNLRRQQMLVRLAQYFAVEPAALRRRLDELRRRPQRLVARRTTSEGPAPAPTRWEQELLEILACGPEAAAAVVARVSVEQVDHAEVAQILAAASELAAEGAAVDFESLMLRLEETPLKHRWLAAVETVSEKQRVLEEAGTPLDPHRWLEQLLAWREEKDAAQTGRMRRAALAREDVNEQEALELLERHIRDRKRRQGFSAPTDG